ncbi:hypothetical protein MVEN_02437300 [Mycena venus]|uniref:DUF6534 domain-containing protein n=1 Tax=Mycena venus TaxID=2733690 RepID=A0A8H7CCD3_9AGAR|nr:hypothetical protein MVEN_02437300 [Mycena venus]
MSNATATQSSSPQETILLVNPSTAIGPIFIGNAFNWMFMGLLIMQVYNYCRKFPKDRLMIKILVFLIFVLVLMQTAFGTHEAWWFSIQNWGNVLALQGGSWTTVISPIMCGTISAKVQIFYAFRIRALRRSVIPRLLAILIVLLALSQSLAAIIGSLLLLESLTQENLIRLHPLFTLWLAGRFSTDVLITGSLVWILQTSKSTSRVSQTDSLLNRLILNTIQTGTVTVVCAGIALALFVKYTDRNYYFAFAYILGKLYSNSFMATMNSRVPREPIQRSDSIGMRIQVSRRTDRDLDGVQLSEPMDTSRDTLANWQTTTESNAEHMPAPKKHHDLTTHTDVLRKTRSHAI